MHRRVLRDGADLLEQLGQQVEVAGSRAWSPMLAGAGSAAIGTPDSAAVDVVPTAMPSR
jgi:hypothetical protein